ncbi:DNA-processing protein DprA [Bacillus sp. FJAT-50079]|nr:DNA-processing protein DprA [Bacillus sp. FJAT-50079]
MAIFREKLLHLIHCRTLTHRSLKKLLTYDPRLTHLYSYSIDTFQQILQLEPPKIKAFLNEFQSLKIKALLKLYETKGISIIHLEDQEYPSILKEIHDPPFVLFTIGNKQLLQKNMFAVVGARDANLYAKETLDLLIPPLIKRGFVIVSGLAKGTDTLAHARTIEHGGKTIAVLGGGFFHLYPRENLRLANEMKQDHLLVSEYPPIQKPEKWHFPMRNRIISGLAKGTLVVQAKSRSGSLITADFALESGREVFAVPGPIHHPLSAGTNHLIQQGAKLVLNAQDILDEIIVD